MRIGGRSISKITSALRYSEVYRAAVNMLRYSPDGARLLGMYATGRGEYPRQVKLRTPLGVVAPTLYSPVDLLTVNEVFFRLDYRSGTDLRVVVDVGSNIGLSALYFLTRSPFVRCHLIEPVPMNIERLHLNLAGYADRWMLYACALDAVSGQVEFGTASTGRYGGIGKSAGDVITVPCLGVNELLQQVLDAEGFIDVLKIDPEGAEFRTLGAIDPYFLPRIGRIHAEIGDEHIYPQLDGFRHQNFRTIRTFTRV